VIVENSFYSKEFYFFCFVLFLNSMHQVVLYRFLFSVFVGAKIIVFIGYILGEIRLLVCMQNAL
jgi:hypothetical protein